MRGVTAAGGYWVDVLPFEGELGQRHLTYCSESLAEQRIIKLFLFEGWERRLNWAWPRCQLLAETTVLSGQEDKVMRELLSQVLGEARERHTWKDALAYLGLVDA